jgi:hypothetical protein
VIESARPRGPTRRAFVGGALAGAVALPARAATRERLEIVGPELRLGDTPVRLIGLAAGDPLYIRKDRPSSDYRVMAESWRANTVRISLHPGHWREDRNKALRALADNVFAARAAGLFATRIPFRGARVRPCPAGGRRARVAWWTADCVP